MSAEWWRAEADRQSSLHIAAQQEMLTARLQLTTTRRSRMAVEATTAELLEKTRLRNAIAERVTAARTCPDPAEAHQHALTADTLASVLLKLENLPWVRA